MEWKTLSEQIVELQGKLHAAELQVGELQRKLDAATNDLEGFEEENEKLEKRANERDCAAHVASHELEESNRLVGELQKKLDFAAELGRKSMENFDDDLEERPMRHALGALHRQWELFLGVIEKPVGEGPTDRKCCTEAYARGYAVGKEHMAAGIVTEPVIEKRVVSGPKIGPCSCAPADLLVICCTNRLDSVECKKCQAFWDVPCCHHH